MLPAAIESNPYRLPRTTVPSRYEITLAPDVDQRDFVGQVVIHLDVREALTEIVCNAADMAIDQAWVTDAAGVRTDATSALDAERERVTFSLARTLPRGTALLHVQFHAPFNENLCGLYASTYTASDATTAVIAATQCQPTDARRVFPCWDEPDLKAVFAITVIVGNGLTAISNGPEIASTAMASGKRAVRFADTMSMSTYLVCIVVGELHVTAPIDVDGVELRVVCVPGKEKLAAFALETGAFALRYFTDYYGIAYPDNKLDLIALPDFAAGAMENVGAVTFRETLLLIDADNSPRADLERVADVICHEIAHMWFGDLVTMRWWNGIWLNEAFATFMEVSCVAAFRPEWHKWTGFSLYRAAAFAVDGLRSTRTIEYPVISPADAEGMFDVLTYEKGAAVLRMLEQYLGEARFRDGVRKYLELHAYANTETTDLWDAIELVTAEPVRAMMDTWIFQGGHPLVVASTTANGAERTLHLRQQRFTYLPTSSDTLWDIPVLWRTETAAGRCVLSGLTADVRIPADAGSGPIVVNAGSHGFYRVRYDVPMLALLRESLSSLTEAERFCVVADTWAAVLAGATPATDFLELVSSFTAERSPEVWRVVIAGFAALDKIVTAGPVRDALRRRLADLAQPALDGIGWQRTDAESPLISELRGLLIEALGLLAWDESTQQRALVMLDRLLAGSSPAPEADIVPAIVRIGAATGDEARYDQYVAARLNASPQDAIRYLHALGAFPDRALTMRTLEAALTDDVRGQDAPYLVRDMLGSRDNGAMVWHFVAEHWDTLSTRVPSNAVVRMIETIPTLALVDPVVGREAEAFFRPDGGRTIPQGGKQLAQHLERLAVNRAWRDRDRDDIERHLTSPD